MSIPKKEKSRGFEMILLRHFTEDDAETIRKKQWPDLSIEEIEAIIND